MVECKEIEKIPRSILSKISTRHSKLHFVLGRPEAGFAYAL